MDNVTFSNKSKTVVVLFNDKKIIIGGILMLISKININTKDVARFEFENFEAKIGRSILTIKNKTTGESETFTITNEVVKNTITWKGCKIHAGCIISINSDFTKIKLNGVDNQISEKIDKGVYVEYKCSEGVLSLSKIPQRQNMWNYIYIPELE